MIETYTQTIFAQETSENPDHEVVRLDMDDQLFYDMLKSELDMLIRQPKPGSISKITSYSRSHQMPLM